jgi:hypothetical protein
MAFIDFKNGLDFNDGALRALPAPTLIGLAETTIVVEPLDALERRIVELARTDKLASLRPQRKRSWLAKLIFGPTPPSPMLANERLEALRRLAVRTWHDGYLVPVSALKEAKAAGFTEIQVGAVIDMIARLREPFRRLAA